MPPCRHGLAGDLFPDLGERVAAKPREWVDLMPWVEAGTPATYKTLVIGRRSYTDISAGPRAAVRIGDRIDRPWTCAELARPYLQAIWGEQRPAYGMGAERVPFTRAALAFLDVPQPLHCVPSRTVRPFVYLDVTSAFTAIYRNLTLDLRYEPDADPPRLGVGRIRFLEVDELARHRGARLAVVGVARARKTLTLRYGESVWRRMPNRFLAPDLWGLIAHQLHAMAWDMVTGYGAVYVHTDGYIVPAERAAAAARHLAGRWRVAAHVRARGEGYVRGLSDWAVGRHAWGGLVPDYAHERPDGLAITNLIGLPAGLRDRLAAWRAEWVDRTGTMG